MTMGRDKRMRIDHGTAKRMRIAMTVNIHTVIRTRKRF